MAGVREGQGQLVFGLDIGTRSIVGTVGYMSEDDKFHVLAQRVKEHETRAMLDGQIHDIGKVAGTIAQVKELLDNGEIGRIINVQIRFAQPPRALDYNSQNLPWRVQSDISGGGYFYDLAPHQLDLLQDMLHLL